MTVKFFEGKWPVDSPGTITFPTASGDWGEILACILSSADWSGDGNAAGGEVKPLGPYFTIEEYEIEPDDEIYHYIEFAEAHRILPVPDGLIRMEFEFTEPLSVPGADPAMGTKGALAAGDDPPSHQEWRALNE